MGKILRTEKLTTFSELIIVIYFTIGVILEEGLLYFSELKQQFQNN